MAAVLNTASAGGVNEKPISTRAPMNADDIHLSCRRSTAPVRRYRTTTDANAHTAPVTIRADRIHDEWFSRTWSTGQKGRRP